MITLTEREYAVQKVKAVKSHWIRGDDLEELKRLERGDPKTFDKMNVAFKHGNPRALLIAFMRGVEVLKALSDTHYCFFHGQSTEAYVLTRVITEVVEQRNPELKGKYRKFFRLPEGVANHAKTVDAFFTKYPKLNSTYGATDDYMLKKELLSVNAYPLCNYVAESAWYFVLKNYNVLRKDEFIPLFKQLFKNGDAKSYNKICVDAKTPLGILQVIAIPKKYASDNSGFVYSSSIGGRPTKEPLESLINQQEFYKEGLDQESLNDHQHRILTCMGGHPEEALVISLSEMTADQKRICYTETKKLAVRLKDGTPIS